MIYYLKGTLAELAPGFAVVDCNGIGYGAMITSKTYEKLVSEGAYDASGEVTGISVTLYTHVKIKDENSFEVFGFCTKAESAMFALLQTVSGIGTRASLAILSVLTPLQICTAIRTDDTRLIATAQGVGQKAAQKICIDLKSKADTFTAEYNLYDDDSFDDVSRETIVKAKENLDENQKLALEALTNLGYTKPQAQKALSKASGETVEELIRTALSQLF